MLVVLGCETPPTGPATEGRTKASDGYLSDQATGMAAEDADRLIAEMKSPAAEERIVENAALGAMLGVRGTPSVYLDGRYVETWGNLAFWQAVLAPAPATQPSVTAPR